MMECQQKNTEIWKNVVGYEGYYEVSSMGRVRNFETKHVLKHFLCSGYPRVGLRRENKKNGMYIHRLVATAFIPNPNNYPQVNHRDETRHNNNVENLEWCTCQYNLAYGTARERMTLKRSMPILQKTKDGKIVKAYQSSRQAERETGISNRIIRNCVNGNRKFAGGYIWEENITLEEKEEVQTW